MKHLGLFSGIGGFELAAQWAGLQNVASVEIDPFCADRLRENFNHEIIQRDIREIDPAELPAVDIISGGDPCQPHSIAGLRRGQADDRYLWPEMFRIISAKRPSWIVNENVGGSITNGIVDRKADDLEAISYAVLPVVLPAEAVGAAHIRERVWLIAYDTNRYNDFGTSGEFHAPEAAEWLPEWDDVQQPGQSVDLWDKCTHPDRERFKELYTAKEPINILQRLSGHFGFGPAGNGYIPKYTAESCIAGMLNGLPKELDYAERPKRIKALGNAVVPQIPFLIFSIIKYIHQKFASC